MLRISSLMMVTPYEVNSRVFIPCLTFSGALVKLRRDWEICVENTLIYGLVVVTVLVGGVALKVSETKYAAGERLKEVYEKRLSNLFFAFGVSGANGFLRAIRDANPGRSFLNLARRIIKIQEEMGEVSEAFLVATTSAVTRKKKTKDDVREELIDVAIVALDCALTRMPGEEGLSDNEIETKIMGVLAEKLGKWRDQRDKMGAFVEDDV